MSEYKLIISAFLAGTGLILWVVTFLLSPTNKVQSQVDLLRQEVANLRDNHIHTLQGDVTTLKGKVEGIEKGQLRIETILDERLPAKR